MGCHCYGTGRETACKRAEMTGVEQMIAQGMAFCGVKRLSLE